MSGAAGFNLANDDRIPAIGLGTWKAEPGRVGAVLTEAIRAGYRHIDCAPLYGNERELGEALHGAIRDRLVSRDELWVTSKLWNASHRRQDVLPALKQTLSDLQLDDLDLYLIHWPVALRPGTGLPETADDFLPPEAAPLGETWSAMEDAVDAGLCRHIGLSNFNPRKMLRICEGARIAPAVNQVESHPFLAQPDLLEACRQAGVIMAAYSPLGSPDRPDRLRKDSDPVVLDDPVIRGIADRHGVSPAQVALAWAVKRGTVVVAKTVTPARLAENLASPDVPLDDEDMTAIASIDRGYRLIDGSIWCPEGSPYSLRWLWEE